MEDDFDDFIVTLKQGSYFECGLIQALQHFIARKCFIFPEPLNKLAQMIDAETNLPLFRLKLYKSIDKTVIKDPAVLKSKELLLHSFKISEIDVLEKLFSNDAVLKETTMACITANVDSEMIVAATSLCGMSAEGCYIGYLSVLNLDLKGITKYCRSSTSNIRVNSYERLGLGSFLVLFTQLVSFETWKTWHVYTWSNNKKNSMIFGSNEDLKSCFLSTMVVGLIRLKTLLQLFNFPRTLLNRISLGLRESYQQ
jgi:hypothetical protein